MKGNLIVAFADTLFRANFKINPKEDGVIWVHKVENPKQFGVVKLGKEGIITEFVEKPEHFVSDLAIIGIYALYMRKLDAEYNVDEGDLE